MLADAAVARETFYVAMTGGRRSNRAYAEALFTRTGSPSSPGRPGGPGRSAGPLLTVSGQRQQGVLRASQAVSRGDRGDQRWQEIREQVRVDAGVLGGRCGKCHPAEDPNRSPSFVAFQAMFRLLSWPRAAAEKTRAATLTSACRTDRESRSAPATWPPGVFHPRRWAADRHFGDQGSHVHRLTIGRSLAR